MKTTKLFLAHPFRSVNDGRRFHYCEPVKCPPSFTNVLTVHYTTLETSVLAACEPHLDFIHRRCSLIGPQCDTSCESASGFRAPPSVGAGRSVVRSRLPTLGFGAGQPSQLCTSKSVFRQ